MALVAVIATKLLGQELKMEWRALHQNEDANANDEARVSERLGL